MKFGTLTSNIDGLWQVVHDSGALGSAVTTYSITGLNGDVDCEYELYAFIKNGYNGAASYAICPNNDTTSGNYGYQIMQGANTTASAARATGSGWYTSYNAIAAINSMQFSLTKIIAKSGYVRTSNTLFANDIATTTVTQVGQYSQSWNNTVDNITSLVIVSGQASAIGVGSRFILLKKVNASSGIRTGIITPNKISNCWKRVYDNTLSAATTSVTVSGLTGNTTPIIRVRARLVNGYNGANQFPLLLNNDSGANYGSQWLYGSNTTVGAARVVGAARTAALAQGAALNDITMYEGIIFAPSGYIRPMLFQTARQISTTTVTLVSDTGETWNNTADQLTSLVFSSENASGIGIGSHIEVDELTLT